MELAVQIAVLVIALGVVLSAIFTIRLAGQFKAVLDRLERTVQYINFIRPRIDHILENLDGELVEIRSITERVDHMAGDVEDVSGEVRRAILPLVSQVSALTYSLRHVNAAVTGAKVAMSALRDRRH